MAETRTTATEPTRLTVNDVDGRMERGEPLAFVDARNPKAWAESNIKLPGAIRMLPGQVDEHLHELPRDRPIIAYCT